METLRYVVLANVLLAVLSFAHYALLRRETFFGANRLVLWLCMLVSLAGPLLELPDWRPQPVRYAMQRTAQVIVPRILPKSVVPQPEVTITFPNGKTFPANQNPTPSTDWSWQNVLIGLYAICVLGLFIRFVIQLTSLLKLIRKSPKDAYEGFVLVRNETVTSPFSFFSWVVINPLQHTPGEIEQILRHERVHVKARHSLDMIGAELVCIVFWFNPAAYLFRYLIKQTLEFSADHTVLSEGVDAKAYQYNLLKVSLGGKGLAVTSPFSSHTLNQRVSMMNSRRSTLLMSWRYLIWLVLALISGLACQHISTTTNYRYIQQTDNKLFGIITAHTSDNDLDTLRQALARQNVTLTVKKLSRLTKGQIGQIELMLGVPKPGHPIDVSVGSSLGNLAIPVIGLQCTETGCQLGSVNDQFPQKLLLLAEQESTPTPVEFGVNNTGVTSNAQFGLYSVFFRNDFLESNYFGLRNTLVRMTPDYHLDLYPESRQAVVFLDGKEINQSKLRAFHVLDLKKVVVFKGKAAVIRLGDQRAEAGLVLLSRFQNIAVRDKYVTTPLLEIAYPQLFAQP